MTTRSLYIDISQDPALTKVARSEVAAATVAPRELTGQPDSKNIVINTNVETTKVYVKETFNLPGGSNSQIQINQGGQFLGDPGLTYNAQTDTLRTGSLIITDNLTLSGTANFGTTLVGYATETYVSDFVNQEIAGLINSAPGALDTLGEIATTIETLQNQLNSIATGGGNNVSCQPNMDTVVYTASQSYTQTLKILFKVEGVEDSNINWDTQSCEMMVAKGFRDNQVASSVYGIVYTSNAALATFNARWNSSSSRIEITCRPTSMSNSVEVRLIATEIQSSD